MPTRTPKKKPARSSNAHARTLAKHTPAREVSVKVDAALKKRWDALFAIVETSKARGASDFDHLWEAVGEIVERELFVIGGYRDAADFVERVLGEKPRNASRFIRVAKLASPAEESEYGVTKLDAALSFIEAKLGAPLEHPPLPIAFEKLRVPMKDGSTKPLADARVEEIQAATRGISKRKSAPTSSVERAIAEQLAKHPKFREVHVRVRNGLANFVGVPVGALGVFGTVVKGVKWREGSRG